MVIKGKSVLVTGGAGFIGSHLVDRLVKEKPSNLVVVDNLFQGRESNLSEAKTSYPQLKIYYQDASDYEAMKDIVKSEGIQVVFNLAAVPLPASLVHPGWTYEQNIKITLCWCELAKDACFDTLIQCSSSEAYGSCQYVPMDESHPLNPTTPYGASKAATDLMVLSYVNTFNIDASIIRPFNNYGPRQNEESYAGVIPLTIKRILNGEAPVVYGDGKQTRDYLYVTETAGAAVEIYNCQESRGKVINIASGSEISINKLVKLIAGYMDCDKAIVYEKERPGDVRRFIAGINLAQDLINFKPRINLEEGLKLTIKWYMKAL
jgi:UDP-glucose 4-epimerase